MTGTSQIIGHRGASRDAPENTMAAFRLAWEQGADGIEADFRLCRDGRIVCMHDASTARTADADLRVEASSLAELRRLDAGRWKGERWAGERIPTLGEVIDGLPPGKRLFIELKSGPEIVAPLAGILEDAEPVRERITLLSFSSELIGLLKERLPAFRACWLSDLRAKGRTFSRSFTPEEVMAALAGCKAAGLACRAGRHLDERLAAALLGAGYELHVWTVDAAAAARRYAALGARSIFTNRPGWLRERM